MTKNLQTLSNTSKHKQLLLSFTYNYNIMKTVKSITNIVELAVEVEKTN